MSVPSAWTGFLYDEARQRAGDPRTVRSAAWARLREMSGATDVEIAEAIGLAVGRFIRPGLIRLWCEPGAPSPMADCLVALARLVGPAAGPVLAGMVA